MTRDEAKTKWCPMVRVSFGPTGETLSNRLEYERLVVTCIPDDCACWVKSQEVGKENEGRCGLTR